MNIEYVENGVNFGETFVSLDEITKKVNKVKVKNQKLSLMTIEWDGGRGFDGCCEQYTDSIENLKRIKEILIGKTINFGEIAGKHSEIYGEMEECDFNISEENKDVTDFLSKHPSGHEYDHSFLHTFNDWLYDADEDEVSETEKTDFLKILK